MKTLVANAPLAIAAVSSVLLLIVAHELLAAIAGPSNRFQSARRWLVVAFTVLGLLLAILIVLRFYYLRAT